MVASARAARRAGVVTKAGQEFRADLVIDAAGRRSPMPGWLAAGGYGPPQEVEVDPHVSYSSRLYKMPPQAGPPPIFLTAFAANPLRDLGRREVV